KRRRCAATPRAEAVLPGGFVARSVEYRLGYTPSLAPCPRAKRLSANCILSRGLVSMAPRIVWVKLFAGHAPEGLNPGRLFVMASPAEVGLTGCAVTVWDPNPTL